MPELYNSSNNQEEAEEKLIVPNSDSDQPIDTKLIKTTQKPEIIKDKPKPKSENKPMTSQTTHDARKILRDELPSRNPFAAFMVFPKHVRVEIQDPQEEILLLLRRHIITNVRWILIAALMIIAPMLLSIVPLIDPLPARFQLMTLVIWYFICTGYIIESFLSWYFNVYIITDERVIDVDFLNLLYKNIGAAKIDNIEEISSKTTGAIRSVFNFGTVLIQTAGESPQIEFEDVPQPQKVAKLLNELLLEEEQEKIEGRLR